MAFSHNVVLIGPMGAGKTTIGKLLAQELGFSFHDTDTEIEERTGADINWIFDLEGEEGFRRRETEVLRELCQKSRSVIATGGGAVVSAENRRVLSAAGTVVYLQASVGQQMRRTERDQRRPMLRGGNREEVLSDLMDQRAPLYQEIADVTVHTSDRGARTVAREIAQRLLA